MELVTGPMESIIALQKIATTTTALFTTTETAGNAVKTTTIGLNWATAASIWAVVAPLLVIIAILAVFYLAWKHQEFIIDNATKALGGFKDIVVGLGKEGMKVVDTLEDMARGLANIAGTVTLGIIPGFGGD